MQENLISIITPMYNGEKYVSQTIETVLSQSFPHWEMLIVDDGSRDASPKIVSAYAQRDNRVRLIQQPNGGSASARNNALRQAKGRYICFLDADDLWDSNFLEEQLNFLKNHQAALVFSSFRRINAQGDPILKPFIVPTRVNYTDLLKTCSISCLTALFDRAKVGEVYFREELRSMRDDFVFWLSILKHIDYAYGNPTILASYRVFASSTTGNKRKVIKPQFNVYYKVEKLGLIRSLYYLAHWAINGYLKYH
ncbi:glycosyltransferase family 2 protein [Millionella massiliensis]|uniref:glycosyltransferase family 2 protein n=1 Tax=Millionella massiliensis TaxID=1871023 RepID=UPI0024B70B38|nr:glycosyltransferase family 2 protein [Millionella massiliensis]